MVSDGYGQVTKEMALEHKRQDFESKAVSVQSWTASKADEFISARALTSPRRASPRSHPPGYADTCHAHNKGVLKLMRKPESRVIEMT